MRPLSPVEAISPAFHRTRTVLLPPGAVPGQNAPFRFWFYFKVVLTAAFTQSSFYGASIGFFMQGIFMAMSFAGAGSTLHRLPIGAPSRLTSVILVLAVVLGAIAIAVWILLGWLWCRLRFTLFDLVVFRHGRVGVAWSRYSAPAWRFLGIAILITLAFVALLAVTAGPLLFHLVLTVRNLTPQQINANPAIILSHILPMYGIMLVFFVLVFLVDAIMQDFILPPMALENAPAESSARRFFHLLRTNSGSFVLYLILRLALQMGLGVAASLVLFVVLGVVAFAGVGLGFVLYHSLFHAGPAGAMLFILYCVIAGLLGLAFYILTVTCIGGTIAVFRQCYAVYYYGSHYQQLGDFLEPPPEGIAAAAHPVPPPLPVMPPVQQPPPVW